MDERIEWIEERALQALHDSAPPDLRQQLGLRLERVGPVTVSVCAREPRNILLNRTLGLSAASPSQPGVLQKILDIYRQARVERFFIPVTPGPEIGAIGSEMRAAGLEPARGWTKFTRDSHPAKGPTSSLNVVRAGTGQAADFAAIAGHGFDFHDAELLLATLVSHPNWHLFLSMDEDLVIGTGALYIESEIAWFDFGATWPEHRSRGSQTALLCHRINYAIGQGCEFLVTATGEAVPDDPQHSFNNILRAGFSPAYKRPNWQPVGSNH